MFQKLRLTEYEKRWNDYYDTGGKRGVLLRRYPYQFNMDSSTRSVTVYHQSARRSRVHMVTWAGDVNAITVDISTSTGESYTVDPVHLPILAGSNVLSTACVSSNLPGYPSPFNVRAQSMFAWIVEPNIVLPGVKQLLFKFGLENPLDTTDPDAPYLIAMVVHQWEFPGFEGGAK